MQVLEKACFQTTASQVTCIAWQITLHGLGKGLQACFTSQAMKKTPGKEILGKISIDFILILKLFFYWFFYWFLYWFKASNIDFFLFEILICKINIFNWFSKHQNQYIDSNQYAMPRVIHHKFVRYKNQCFVTNPLTFPSELTKNHGFRWCQGKTGICDESHPWFITNLGLRSRAGW